MAAAGEGEGLATAGLALGLGAENRSSTSPKRAAVFTFFA